MKKKFNEADAINVKNKTVAPKMEDPENTLHGLDRKIFQLLWITPMFLGFVFFKFPFFVVGWAVARVLTPLFRLFKSK